MVIKDEATSCSTIRLGIDNRRNILSKMNYIEHEKFLFDHHMLMSNKDA